MKQKSSFSIKDVVAIGVGAALFVVIAMLPIPAPARIQAFSCNMPFRPSLV